MKKSNDCIYTPDWAVVDMLNHFKPTGCIMDPCKGDGAFTNRIPECQWCEISEGRDFFDFSDRVDWIISNPPYSNLRKFILHSFKVSDNVVYIIPIWKAMMAYGLIDATRKYGGIKHIRWYGTGSKLNFPMGNAIGAIHYKRGYHGNIEQSYYDHANNTRL